jgi:outer membrane immunogenic protein
LLLIEKKTETSDMRFRSIILGVALTGAAVLNSAYAGDLYGPAMSGGSKDVPYIPAPGWQGFYFGVDAGGAWNANSVKDRNITGTAGPFDFSVPTAGTDPSGAFTGSVAGYNYQAGAFVFGVEADIHASDISDSRTRGIGNAIVNGVNVPLPAGLLSSAATTSLDWFGTVRGRIGYNWIGTLVYFTGGLAYGKIDDQLTIRGPLGGPLAQFSRRETETGYVLGGGIEFKPRWWFLSSPNWSIKAEYQYINLGNERLTGTAIGGIPVTASQVDHTFNTVLIGLNYQLPSCCEPLK